MEQISSCLPYVGCEWSGGLVASVSRSNSSIRPALSYENFFSSSSWYFQTGLCTLPAKACRLQRFGFVTKAV